MRDWIALYPSILRSRKWRRLDIEGRLAWIVLLMESVHSQPEGTIEDHDTAVFLLERDGFPDGNKAVVELIRAEVLGLGENNELTILGWAKWQKAYRGPSDDPATKAAAERARYWEKKADELEAKVANLSEPVTSLGGSGIEERRGEDIRGEDSPPTPPSQTEEGGTGFVGLVEGDDIDAVDVFYELTGSRAWGKDSGKWLQGIEANFGREATIDALRVEWRSSMDKRTLISRAEALLARAAEKTRQAKPKAPVRPPGISPEVATRQRAELARMMGRTPEPGNTGGHRDDDRNGNVHGQRESTAPGDQAGEARHGEG